MKNLILGTLIMLGIFQVPAFSQACTPQGDPSVYGTNNVWIGYVYDNYDLTNYKGYVTVGTPGNANFEDLFGGALVSYPTNGCAVLTETFSIRYRLIKTFVPGLYDVTISGDDGYRLSLDGGATWVINNWSYLGNQKNTVTMELGGTYNMVLEYFDYAHNNSISFNVSAACLGTENTSVYGTGNIWRGYVYNGMNFEYFKGIKNEGSASSPNFDQNFGGNHVRFSTSACALLTEHFSVRYRLSKNFVNSSYSFIIGSEDGYRLSLDGGTSWLIDNWGNTGYTSSSVVKALNGNYDMVLEYRENTGANRIMFSVGAAIVLPVNFISFSGNAVSQGVQLHWKIGGAEDGSSFEIERSKDAVSYTLRGAVTGTSSKSSYSFTDHEEVRGRVYYRIKMTDAAGQKKYSHPVIIESNSGGIRIYPTMVRSGTVNLVNEKAVKSATMLFTDISGYTVMSRQLGNLSPSQTTSVYLSSETMSKGVYLVHLMEDGVRIKTERIVVQ